MATHDILVFSWNDIFPSRAQSGSDTDLVGETFTFNGGGDVVTYDDRFGDRNELGDNTGGLDDRLTGTIDGVAVNELINPEYAYEIQDGNGDVVGKIYALTKATSALSSIEGFVFDFQPVHGETYTLSSRDGFPQTPFSSLFICFASGTLIDTVDGPVAVEDITAGTEVITRDNGPQPVLWVGAEAVSFAHISSSPKSAPVLINEGALGDGVPEQMLMVSPQHRVLVHSKVARTMFGSDEVMVPAVKLTELDGVERISPEDGVTYHHVLCASHELVRANGQWAETLYIGEQAEIAIGPEKMKEILAQCPEVADMQMHPLAQLGEQNRGRLRRFSSRVNARGLRTAHNVTAG